MAEFELNPEILQTAAGSITGDIAQIQTAVYGREVHASIAECLYLLLQCCEQSASELTDILAQIQAELSELKSKSENHFKSLDETVERLKNVVESCQQSVEDYKQETDQRLENAENVLETCTQDLDKEKSRSDIVIAILESELNKAAGYPDIDGDGRVSASDAGLILNASAQGGSGGDNVLTEEQEKLADVNADGKFNAEDAALISEFATALGAGLYQNDAIG